MLQIKSFEFGPFGTNMYVVSNPQGEVLIVDPACSNSYEQQQLYAYVSALSDNVTIIATHAHLDHLWGAAWACEQWHTSVLMHEADIALAQAMQQQYDLFGIQAKPVPFPILPLRTEESPFTGMTILATPGHSPGSICLYWKEEKVLISGDTLFQMGYGRTDLPGGNMGQLIDSLHRLMDLPEDTQVYPGHGGFTTIGAEKR